MAQLTGRSFRNVALGSAGWAMFFAQDMVWYWAGIRRTIGLPEWTPADQQQALVIVSTLIPVAVMTGKQLWMDWRHGATVTGSLTSGVTIAQRTDAKTAVEKEAV